MHNQSLAWLTDRPIAHRGLHSADAPENSLTAFQRAVDSNFHIELDVQLTKDNNVAVFHDSSLLRMTGLKRNVSIITRDELAQLHLAGGADHPPLLDEVLDLVAGRVGLLIEIKNEGVVVGPLEHAVVELLKGYSGPYAIQSFNPLSLMYLRRHAPQICRGQLAGDFPSMLLPGFVRWYLKRGVMLWPTDPDFIALQLSALPDAAITAIRAKGLPLLVWTVQSAEEEKRAVELADNMIFEGFSPVAKTR